MHKPFESLLNNMKSQMDAEAAAKKARSERSKKAAATVRENKRIAALKPKVRNLFAPAPVYRAAR